MPQSPLPRSLYLSLVAVILMTSACRNSENNSNNKITISPNAGRTIPKTAVPPLDKSPMDVIYFPSDYPVRKMSGEVNTRPVARVIYSRPAKDGRVIFGKVLPYGQPWRMGANEATEIEFFRDVRIQNKRVAAGRYILYSIPFEDKWTVILNNDLYTWGLQINKNRDLYKFDFPVQKLNFPMEFLSMQFDSTENGMSLSVSWDESRIVVPVDIHS